MNIKPLLNLLENGYMTLQIEEIEHFSNGTAKRIAIDEMPAEWFVRVHSDGKRIVIGAERGYLYWSRIGFMANKSEILAAYSRGRKVNDRGTEEMFLQYADQHFAEVRERTGQYVKKLERNLSEAKKALESGL